MSGGGEGAGVVNGEEVGCGVVEEEEVGAGVVEEEVTAACHVAANPGPVILKSEVKSTCKYPVDDVYILLELTEEPDR